MSQHPSLRSKEKGKKHRSVLKRYERVRELTEKEKWKKGDSVFGLLKLKIVKFKLKKEKAAPAKGAAADAAALPAGEVTAGAAPGAKGAVKNEAQPKKAALPKKEDKK